MQSCLVVQALVCSYCSPIILCFAWRAVAFRASPSFPHWMRRSRESTPKRRRNWYWKNTERVERHCNLMILWWLFLVIFPWQKCCFILGVKRRNSEKEDSTLPWERKQISYVTDTLMNEKFSKILIERQAEDCSFAECVRKRHIAPGLCPLNMYRRTFLEIKGFLIPPHLHKKATRRTYTVFSIVF